MENSAFCSTVCTDVTMPRWEDSNVTSCDERKTKSKGSDCFTSDSWSGEDPILVLRRNIRGAGGGGGGWRGGGLPLLPISEVGPALCMEVSPSALQQCYSGFLNKDVVGASKLVLFLEDRRH